MRKLQFAFLAGLLSISCHPHKDLSAQLKGSFANHLKGIDSSSTLDSVHILWNTSVTERLARIIDDTVYQREFIRVEAQLSAALQKTDKDSIEFFQYEIDYMKKAIDSVTKSISEGDTTRKYGRLIGCAYYITKAGKTRIDSTMVFIDSTSTIRFPEFIDSALSRTVHHP